MEPILLKQIATPDQWTIGVYEGQGGYRALRKALSMKPAEVIEEVKKSGLRGRGGAGFGAGAKWSFVPQGDGKPHYLCVNADESEPGTFKDRLLIERDPHRMLEGAIIASWAIGAREMFIYVRGEFRLGLERIERAVEEARAKGYLGHKVLGTDWDLEVDVHRGAGAYICGEETALLESLEGKVGWPRLKPPFPALVGLFRCPTVVNNVETLSSVPFILEHGADAYRKYGTEKSPGTKLFSISGHVARPGVYELPLGTPLKHLLYDVAGGIPGGKRLKAVVPGGSSVPILTASEAETVNLDYEALAAVKSMLGSGGVIVFDETACLVRMLAVITRFYWNESCGQCTPCREGTGWMHKILDRIEAGAGRPGDVDLLAKVADNIFGRTLCPLGDAAAMPVQSYLKKFRAEFEAHVARKGCPFEADGAGRGGPLPRPSPPKGGGDDRPGAAA